MSECDSPPVSPVHALSPEKERMMEVLESEKVDKQKNVGRRGGVAAQSVSQERMKDWVKPVFPKSEAGKEFIKETIKTHEKLSILFGHLEDQTLEDVANAFQSVEVDSGVDVIRQGDDGDRLYIISEGEVDIFVRRGPKVSETDKGSKVVSFGPRSLFGELALMYSQPRAATVTVASPKAELWALDRDAFQMLLATTSATNLAMYEGWLKEVPIFAQLNHFEVSRLAECVESQLFDDGEDIVKQGEPGDRFYIIEEGTASAYINGDKGEVEVKKYVAQGEYFGELALLSDEGRKATVRATGTGCAVVSLSKTKFTNLLGPLVDLLREKAADYPQYASFLK